MDDIRGSPVGRRLSQIFDPIARLTSSDFVGSSSSAPCSPRLGIGSRNYDNANVHEANTRDSGPESPRLLPRQRAGSTRQAPVPPPRSQQRNDSRTLPCDNNIAHGRRDKSLTEKTNIGYVELRENDKKRYRSAVPPPFSFNSESSGRVEYADKRNLYGTRPEDFGSYGNFENDTSSEASSPIFEGTGGGGSSIGSNVDRILSAYAAGKQHQPFRRASIDRDMTFASSISAATSASDDQRERFDVRPSAYSSSKSFDAGYSATVEELNWQERCLELQLELHRSRSQATRVRDMLREKVRNLILN